MQKNKNTPKNSLPPPQFPIVEREIEFTDFSLPRGCEARNVEVAGICARVRSDSRRIISHIDRQYRQFHSGRRPDFLINAAVSRGIGSRERLTIFTKTKGKKLFIECGFIRGIIDAEKREGKVWVEKGQEDNVDIFIRNCFSFFLEGEGGMLVHAAALASHNRAFLFPGRSGAGKTTLSKSNRAGMLVLNDDICAVRRVKNEFRIFGTPFWGSEGALAKGNNKSIKMDSVLFLKKGGRNSVSELHRAEAAGRLMGCVMHITKDRKKTAGVFDLCSEIAMLGMCRELSLEKGAKLGGLL